MVFSPTSHFPREGVSAQWALPEGVSVTEPRVGVGWSHTDSSAVSLEATSASWARF